jgi:hypothetical protein
MDGFETFFEKELGVGGGQCDAGFVGGGFEGYTDGQVGVRGSEEGFVCDGMG